MHGRETASIVGGALTMTGSEHKGFEAVRRSGEIARKWRRGLMRKCGEMRGKYVAMMIERR
jgi:hypothetical protein